MTWLVISWFLAVGVMPDGLSREHVYFDNNGKVCAAEYTPQSNLYTTDIGFDVTLHSTIRLWGATKTYAAHRLNAAFSPVRSDFFTGASLLFGNVEAGISHECDHIFQDINKPMEGAGRTRTELFVKIKGETRW